MKKSKISIAACAAILGICTMCASGQNLTGAASKSAQTEQNARNLASAKASENSETSENSGAVKRSEKEGENAENLGVIEVNSVGDNISESGISEGMLNKTCNKARLPASAC